MAAWAPTTSGESCVLEPSSALRYTGPGPPEQSHENGRPRDYREITVVMTGGTGFKTRSVRGNAGDTLKLDIDPDPSRLDGRAPPGGKRRTAGEVQQAVQGLRPEGLRRPDLCRIAE